MRERLNQMKRVTLVSLRASSKQWETLVALSAIKATLGPRRELNSGIIMVLKANTNTEISARTH